MNQSRSDDDSLVIGTLLLAIVGWLLLLLFSVFIISQWLTRMFLTYVVNPLLNNALDRHDGPVVLIAAALWCVIGGIMFPLATTRGWIDVPADQIRDAWLGAMLFGACWGAVVGVWILLIWWSDLGEVAPVGYDVVQLLDAPLELASSPPPVKPITVPGGSRANGELSVAELEQLILGGEG
jgi:hypothetical protein